MWRQEDFFKATIGPIMTADGAAVRGPGRRGRTRPRRATRPPGSRLPRSCTAPRSGRRITSSLGGNRIVLSAARKMDPVEVWRIIADGAGAVDEHRRRRPGAARSSRRSRRSARELDLSSCSSSAPAARSSPPRSRTGSPSCCRTPSSSTRSARRRPASRARAPAPTSTAGRASSFGDHTIVIDDDGNPDHARRRRGRPPRPPRPSPARLLQGREEDGRDLPHHQRRALGGARRHGRRRGRRHDHAARSRLGQHQLRRREDLPRGGRARAQEPPRRVRRRGGRRVPTSAGASGSPRSWHPVATPARPSRSSPITPESWSPATRCPRRCTSSTRWCARRRARPTTAGLARWPEARSRPRSQFSA